MAKMDEDEKKLEYGADVWKLSLQVPGTCTGESM
jgi:hypothetical protein